MKTGSREKEQGREENKAFCKLTEEDRKIKANDSKIVTQNDQKMLEINLTVAQKLNSNEQDYQ